MEAQRISYKEFFARDDIGAVEAFATGGPVEEDDEPIDDLPPPAWFRRVLSTDPFPACDALLQWPTNYPVEADAELNEAEWEEVDPAFFRYSEAELDGWQGIVRMVLCSVQVHEDAGQAEEEAPASPGSPDRQGESYLARVVSSESLVGPTGSQPLLVDTKKRLGEHRACEVIQMAYGNQDQIVQQQTARPRASPPIAKWSAGDINVCAWSNSAPSGGRFVTLTVDRRYRVEQGWKSTRSIRINDVPMVTALLQQAFNQLALRHQHVEGVGPQAPPSPEGGPSPLYAPADVDGDEPVYGE